MSAGRPGSLDRSLPQVLRPRRGRITPYVMAGALLVVLVPMALLIPARWPDRIATVAFAGGIVWVLHRLASVRLEVAESGLTVVNILRRRSLAWEQVAAVRMNPGDPWMYLDLTDDDTVAAMGVQRADGAAALERAHWVAGLVAAR